MKKILVLLFLMAFGTGAFAQKSYVNVVGYPYVSSSKVIVLSGAVPSDMESRYRCDTISMGDILNLLAERGFVVEQMSYSDFDEAVILSKDGTIPPGQTISKGDVNTDGEVNIADVNEVINLILGYVREHPDILERYGEK